MMKFFKTEETGAVFAYEADGSQDAFIQSGLVRMSEIEVQEHIRRVTTPDILLIDSERPWRDAELRGLVWLRDRHRDQLEIEASTTLTGEQFKELLVYMQALRDWPQSPNFPQIEHRPVVPPWIAEQTE